VYLKLIIQVSVKHIPTAAMRSDQQNELQ